MTKLTQYYQNGGSQEYTVNFATYGDKSVKTEETGEDGEPIYTRVQDDAVLILNTVEFGAVVTSAYDTPQLYWAAIYSDVEKRPFVAQ